jgi:formylglycine-generating enzyme required for sulfatase activity
MGSEFECCASFWSSIDAEGGCSMIGQGGGLATTRRFNPPRILLAFSYWIAALVVALSVAVGGAFAAGPEQAALPAAQTFRDCSDCPEMVVIPAGNFLMGSSAAETARDVEAALPVGEAKYAEGSMASEHPQHPVSIDRSFALSRYRVTRGEFAAFVRETGYSVDGGCTLWIDHTYPERPDAGWQNPGFAQTDRDPVVCVN